ncbi:DUF3459 domain-containing protein [Chloroflexia bacterium SDU3-3]|nr:DUF3459 domain-containing protein [Chloroflexia bacterium SDU3-3]
MHAPLCWWQQGVFYELIVRSFQDSDGDGSGDLPGLIARLDYLQWLGVDVVWISPIYASPMAEGGYDVADYTAVNPLYGSLDDLDRLIAEAHDRGMRVIIDFVPNHTSDQHPWFQQARASRDSPRRDWYLWQDAGLGGRLPNNWVSSFGGSAWAWDHVAQQYYYHAFLPEQPDLNWRNPAVQAAVADAMRFWLDRGVDGFRMDAIWHMLKDDKLRDNPPNPGFAPGQHPDERVQSVYTRNLPEVHAVIAQLRRVMDAYSDRLLAGELYLPPEEMARYYGAHAPELHLPLNLQLTAQTVWTPEAIAGLIEAYERALPVGGWPNWMLSTHDNARIASRVGEAQARVAAMLLLTMRGTVAIYYGDELGMPNTDIPPELAQDVFERMVPGLGRDPGRTPMLWDDSPHAGFTTGRPWLPLGDHAARNVAAQRRDPGSLLALYRSLIALRRQEPTLVEGTYATAQRDEQVLAYWRVGERGRLLVALNMGGLPASLALPRGTTGRILLSTALDRAGDAVAEIVHLRGDEGLIISCA